MNENFFISKERQLLKDEDFWFLRGEGLKYIESLSSKLWTDYNIHDPGITILEALCYAITELAYRTGFDMKDLLADKEGKVNINQAFFSAKEIFRNNPLTVEDYRKVLIDTVGVHNAFLFPKQNVDDLNTADIPATEVSVYPDCKNDLLSYTKTFYDAIDIRGLYKVLVDLDDTPEFGDLNTGNIFYSFTSGQLIGSNIEAVLSAWRASDLQLISMVILNITSANAVLNTTTGKWSVELHYDDSGTDKTFLYTVRKTLGSADETADAAITTELQKILVQRDILKLYRAKINKIHSILKECWNKLHAQRNLCEDFLSIDTVFYTGIAVCADIEAQPNADIEEILGNVYFAIEQYLSPTVNFYLLSEQLAKGIATEDIFEGPLLEHGFIDTEELRAAQLRSEVRVSDIVNLIMDIEGVVAVKNVILTSYDENGNILQANQKWCITLQPFHKPVLDIFRSKILFFKNKLPFKAKTTEAMDVLRLLEANEERPKLKGTQDDLTMPTGTYYQLDDYYSVKYELPQTYGVGTAGLSNEVSDERKAQAKQLRAYLKFYDQLLANFFSQLYHAKDLFSLDTNIVNTYFAKYYQDNEDIKAVQSGKEPIYRDVLAIDATRIINLETVTNAPLDLPAPADPDYEFFRLRNLYHAKLIEDADTFDDRRNRFLDHLLGRFAETFNNYVFLLYSADHERIAAQQLINDKILFLKDYPIISAERGKAFNYLTDAWPPPPAAGLNVSGLQKRVSRLAGLEDYTQRNLFCLPDYLITNNGTVAVPKYVFSILDKNDLPVFNSIKEYDTLEATENAIDKVYEYMLLKEQYKIEKNMGTGQFEIKLFDDGNTQIAIAEKTFSNNLTASTYLKNVIKNFQPKCNAEGMHLIEHILLRPHFAATPTAPETAEEDYKLMQVCLNKDCVFCGEEDPYSFRISVLLPFWPQRFRNFDYRKYVEDLFEEETPAHIMVKVCWISYTSMKKFETIFKTWLNALRLYGILLKKTDEAKKLAFKEANNKMIEFMATVSSEYPEARLHDCSEDNVKKNPVRLGKTALGSF